MNDQNEWITKEQAKKAIWKASVSCAMLSLKEQTELEAAIDALEPVAQCEDVVSRETVRRAYRNYFGVQYPSEDGFFQVIKKLPSVLPIGQGPEDKSDHENHSNYYCTKCGREIVVLWSCHQTTEKHPSLIRFNCPVCKRITKHTLKPKAD